MYLNMQSIHLSSPLSDAVISSNNMRLVVHINVSHHPLILIYNSSSLHISNYIYFNFIHKSSIIFAIMA